MKYRNLLFIVILFILLFTLSIFTFSSKEAENDYTPTQYEKRIINYFKDIALKSEYDDNPKKVTKWIEPMVLFVIKEEDCNPQMLAIKNTINEINKLATDGFKIMLTNDLSKSNSVLYLCSKNKVAELDQEFYEMLNEDIDYNISGLAYFEFITDTNIINKSLIFINSDESIDIQESTIIEEITQSLGLSFDSKKYPNSIFYEDKYKQEIRTKKYSNLDKDVIKLLYNSKMKPGLESSQLDTVILDILKSK